MPTAFLTDRALVSVSGPEAEHLVQNVITTDLDQLGLGEAKPGALLSPQGKIMFDFLVSRSGPDGLLIECRADIADDLVRRLTLYKLRAKAEIAKHNQLVVRVSWPDDSGVLETDSASSETDTPSSRALRDRRFAKSVWRSYASQGTGDGDADAWQAFRIASGIAESGRDYALGDAFPHDVLLDQIDGVGFKKGCYVGQEVVSRMQHRGTARRRVLIASSDRALPAPGTEVLVAGRTIGALGSVAGQRALAVVRIDKVKAAMDAHAPITAGDATLTLAIPSWARFTFPQDLQAEDA